MKGMNIGDKLYCYCNSNVGVVIDCTIGMFYIIERIMNNRIIITNNRNVNDWFSYDSYEEKSIWYYGKWFYTKQEVRRLKLCKLKNCEG